MIEHIITHFLSHPAGVVGVILTTAAAFGLLKYKADPDEGATLPHEHLQTVRFGMPKQRRQYQMQVVAFWVSIAFLIVGALLQLLDLLLA